MPGYGLASCRILTPSVSDDLQVRTTLSTSGNELVLVFPDSPLPATDDVTMRCSTPLFLHSLSIIGKYAEV